MNSLHLAYAAAKSRPLHSGLSILAIASGITLLCAVFLLSSAIDRGFSRNLQGVDMIVGAKGSPLQLVLSTLYQTDIPTGNIDRKDADKIAKNSKVKRVIPLAVGDNYRGFRVIGTTQDYLELYNAQLEKGASFAKPFDVVAGSATNLAIGAEFAASHGFSADGADVHDDHLYNVTGILKPTGTILDRSLITPLESVQELHEHHHEEHHTEEGITALLISVRSPVDIMNFPREINQSGDLLAAVPSYEMARLSKNLGIGQNIIAIIGSGVMVIAVLMLMTTLASSLTARRYDLAVLRVLGASPARLTKTVLLESLMLSSAGTIIGVIAGHIMAYTLSASTGAFENILLPSEFLKPQESDLLIVAAGLLAGIIAGIIPAISARNTDIAALLSRGKI